MKDKPMRTPLYGMIEEVHVLLVDHGKQMDTDMVDLLESYDYKVTTVMAHEAMSMFIQEKKKIDVIIINVNSPNLLCFKLLEQAVALNIILLFVCGEYNKHLASNALKNGAYLYMKRPLSEEIVKNLWQLVLREEKRRDKGRKELIANGDDQINVDDTCDNNIVGDEEQIEENNMFINTDELRGKRGRKSQRSAKKKDDIEWTVDLHNKFTKDIQQLGKERYYSADTFEVMNVPNLTNDQIASHLQKYCNDNWRPPKERNYIHQGSSSGSQQKSSYNISSERKKRTSCLKFGRMPPLQTNLPNQTQRSPEFPLVSTNCNFASSTQQQLYHPQLQVQPHYVNPFLLDQNDVGGGIEQQHGPLFRLLGSENPIVESTKYRSGMVFNGGDHHTQNGYNLDVSAAHVTTYSGSAMMSNIGVENVRINELEAANANFQQYIGEQNMSHSSNIAAATNGNTIEGSNSNEWENCDAYLNLNNMDDLFQNPHSPSATLPNEHGSGS